MWNYLFEVVGEDSELCGERFFVQCNSKTEAEVTLEMSGFKEEELYYIGQYTDDEAEKMGYDTY